MSRADRPPPDGSGDRPRERAPEPGPGSIIDGAYRLNRVISQGGMGTVYEAIQLRLNRRVAVKIMALELTENPDAMARFRREVKVTSQLAHPNVVQLLDYGMTSSGQPYLVTEFLEGEDLEQRLDRVTQMLLSTVMPMLRQMVSALAAIHAKGIVHRDLKPANVLLLQIDGAIDFVKVVDFGISKVRTSDTKLTKSTTMIGTPEYMSPEQALGRVDDVDHRSDQWALACMVWRMLSGRPPFSAAHINALIERVINEDPPRLLEIAPHVTPQVEKVLRRALAKRQSQRFPTVMAFLRAFEAAAGGGN
jgi:eukaryotic-like serine/threonine-protein kinase